MIKKTINEYNDIINKKYNKNKTRPQMSNIERGSQFAPFAPLTGHRDKIKDASTAANNKQDENIEFYDDI